MKPVTTSLSTKHLNKKGVVFSQRLDYTDDTEMNKTLRERYIMFHTEVEVQEALRNGVVTIVFRKKDGTERVMLGTTKMDSIPEEHHPVGTHKALSNEVCRCFDTEKGEWRSFRWDSVISINF